MSIIAEKGLAGFAVAELARAVGVSSAAPYRHFRDRNAVIAEIARRGFDQLAANLEAARQAEAADPVSALERCAQTHLAFATAEQPVYAVMFEPTFPAGKQNDVAAARTAAFTVLRRAAQAAVEQAAAPDKPPGKMVALHVWTLTHGIADMFVPDRHSSRNLLPVSPEELLEAGLLIYLRSIGLVP